MDLSKLRNEYVKGTLDEKSAATNPFEQFSNWFKEYRSTEPTEPTAVTLGTVDEAGQAWQRIVLLKEFDNSGFVFYSNYESAKGLQLDKNPKASLHFFWVTMERQIHIQGEVSKLSREKSAEYFNSRPRESQLAASASPQSRPIESRQALEDLYFCQEKHYQDQEVPLPDFWGGYQLKPNRFEFWQGGAYRLHDRLEYCLQGDLTWSMRRLNP